MRRFLLVVAALAIPAAVTTVGLAGPATAVTKAKVQSCKKASGTIAGNITLSGCSGGLGTGSAVAKSLATGGTLTWAPSGKTTTFTGSETTATPNKCKGGATEYVFTGTVTGDTTGKVLNPSNVSGKACVNLTTGTIALLPKSKFVL